MEVLYRHSWAEVDLSKIQRNYKKLKKLVQASTKVMPVVKADAYGHGAVTVAQALAEIGADFFAVASLEEALELRAGGLSQSILVFGYTPVTGYAIARQEGISLTIVDSMAFEELVEFVEADESPVDQKKLKIHLKVDSGMSRLGYNRPVDFAYDLHRLREEPNLARAIRVEGCYSHLAGADEKDKTSIKEQRKSLGIYLDAVRQYEKQAKEKVLIHLSNSAGIIDLPELAYDYVRPGIALYGHYPSQHVNQERVLLEPAMSLKSKMAQVKSVYEGTGIGYGHSYQLTRDSLLAIIPIGYADGYNRLLSNQASVLIAGQRCPVLGRVSMDQMVVDVTDLEEIDINDEVVIFGSQGQDQVSVAELAEMIGTIPYELLCAVSKRIPRIYL